jgi:heterodisulfide reductase subunit C
MGKSSDPELEAEILEDVGSYGRQIGQLGDAIRVLLDHVKLGELTEVEQQAVKDVRLQLDQIDRLKRKRKNEKSV